MKVWTVFSKVFAIFMVAVYVALGVFFLVSNDLLSSYPPLLKNIFGIILLFYAIYRGYFVFSKYFSKQQQHENS
jgi:hypothetical protein